MRINAKLLALAKTGDLRRALAALQISVARDPASVEAQYDLGLVYAAAGDASNAAAAFDAALRLQPGYAPAMEAKAAVMQLKATQPKKP